MGNCVGRCARSQDEEVELRELSAGSRHPVSSTSLQNFNRQQQERAQYRHDFLGSPSRQAEFCPVPILSTKEDTDLKCPGGRLQTRDIDQSVPKIPSPLESATLEEISTEHDKFPLEDTPDYYGGKAWTSPNPRRRTIWRK